MQLVTPQTGPEGKKVQRLLVEQGLAIEHEFYLGMLLDRAHRPRDRDGVDRGRHGHRGGRRHAPREDPQAADRPGDRLAGLAVARAREAARPRPARPAQRARRVHARADARATTSWTARCSRSTRSVTTKDGKVLALDAKINFDDNALYRHPELEELRDPSEEDAPEHEAKKWDLSYISLDGNIGCMVNGAGLAMSTMDIIKYYGGAPANFLDVGGGATAEKVTAAFKIITTDPDVKAIFVNIFGGIMKCDTIASGVITAVKEVGLKVPLVVRLEGTNVELGKKMLAESGLNIVAAADMADGAQKVVKAAKEAQ